MKILFIGARLFDDVAFYAEQNGLETILTESNPLAHNLELADKHYLVSRGMKEPMDIAIREDVDAVVPLMGIDGPLLEVAQMKEKLEEDHGIPVAASGVSATSIAKDKLKTKEFLLKNGIKTPKFHKILPGTDEIIDTSFPVVLKQPEGQGGSGVKILPSRVDLDNCLEGLKNSMEEIFLEEFLQGIEVSIEVLRWNGSSVPLVPVYKGETTVEGIHPLNKIKKAPLELEGVNNKKNNLKIQELASKIAELMGIEGTADIDIIFDVEKRETNIIEINNRPSGTRYMTAASTGVNPLHELVDMAAGCWNPEKVQKHLKHFAGLEIPVGTLESERNNYKFRDFSGEESWIVHGPKNYERVTIRGKNLEETFKIAESLKIDLKME
ncbi:ATP-grasp domain-containing protein [Methanobacterium aggregans]|uniref:ATP-grasp domain-containing protein n=1 Tax=Methanobacterium aggregans TaxID=1615586 RepID=UPI001AE1B906|nr:ATP-grasp domain-containing protein [Methanobacterium aggregans]MBP2045559.1 carbamoylphosphate synthase large subunit [Methanobacterium aggregans]